MRSFHLLSLLTSVVLLSCSPSQAYGHEKPHVLHRHINNLSSTFGAKYKRDANVVFTWFEDGQGACGATNGPNDFIVALNSAEYDGGAHCYKTITITINGKTAQAQIADECPGCAPGGLDFSKGLFQYFASLSEGALYGSWLYNSDTTTSSSVSSPSTTHYTLTPTTTIASSSTVSSTMITTSLASTSVPSSASTTSTVPTSTPQDTEVITQINLALLELGSLLEASFKL